MKAYMIVGKLKEAAFAAEQAIEALSHPKTFLRAASLYGAFQDWESCLRSLERGLAVFPDSTELQQAHGEANKEVIAKRQAGNPQTTPNGALVL